MYFILHRGLCQKYTVYDHSLTVSCVPTLGQRRKVVLWILHCVAHSFVVRIVQQLQSELSLGYELQAAAADIVAVLSRFEKRFPQCKSAGRSWRFGCS
jgi:hypothetical protein